MVYLAIKELATTAEDVIMVSSSIMKDMQPNSEVIYRPNAIRALCRIVDVRESFSFDVIILMLNYTSLRWHKESNDFSRQPLLIAIRPFPRLRSSLRTISFPQPKTWSSVG